MNNISYFLIGVFSPWLIVVCLGISLLITLLYLPSLIRNFLRLNRVTQLVLLVALVGGLFVRIYWVPNMDRIYFDEDRYLNYAVSFARFNKQVSVEAAMPNRFVWGKIDQVVRVTVPTVNGLALKLLHYSKTDLHTVAKVFGVLQIILIVIITLRMFKSQTITALSALFMSFLPVPVYWSTSTALDSYFVFFSLFSAVAALLYAHKPSRLHTLFLITTLCMLLLVRFEALLFVLVLFVLIIIMRKHEAKPLVSRKDLACGVAVTLLLLFRVLLSISVLGKTWCCGDATPLEAFQAGYFIRNTIPNLMNLFNRDEFPYVVSICAFIALFSKRDVRIIPLALWIFLYFFIYSFYFAGLFYTPTFSGSYGRYFLMLIPPLSILASITLSSLRNLFHHNKIRMRVLVGFIICTFMLSIVPTVLNYRQLIGLSMYDYYVDMNPRRIQDYLRYVILPQTPKNAIIIHPLSDLVLIHGNPAVYFGAFLKDDSIIRFVTDEMKHNRPVFMTQTYTCNASPENCKKIQKVVDLKPYPLKEATPSGFTLLKLELKKN